MSSPPDNPSPLDVPTSLPLEKRDTDGPSGATRADDGVLLSPPTLDAPPPLIAPDKWPTVTADEAVQYVHPFNAANPILPCRFGNYILEQKLAVGGMGVVYRARQLLNPANPAINRVVALKMILPEKIGTPQVIKRFLSEAENAARLEQHPHIVQVYDVGEIDGQPYFSMQLVAGGSLQQFVDEQYILPSKIAARLIRQVAEAVHFAHQEAGLIHRDIKPSNILLGRDLGSSPDFDLDVTDDTSVSFNRCVAKLSDFGLARNADSAITVQGEIMGTPSFMAPEQARGDLTQIDVRTDVYSLGAVLYALLTARAPFDSLDIRVTIHQVLNEEVVPPRQTEKGKNTPPELETICLKCLEKDRLRRYNTAQELAEELGRYLRDEPILSRPSGWLDRFWRRLRRHRREAILAAVALAALGILAVYLLFEQGDRRRDRDSYQKALDLIEANLDSSLKTNPDRKREWTRSVAQAYDRLRNPGKAGPPTLRALTACAGLAQRLSAAGLKEEALEAGKTTLQLGETLRASLSENDRSEAEYHLAQVKLITGRIHTRQQQFDLAREQLESARDVLSQLAAVEGADHDRYLLAEAEANHQLGEMLNALPDRRKAVEAYQRSIALREGLVKDRDVKEESHRQFFKDLARGHGYLGDTYLDLGLLVKAEEAYLAAEKIRTDLVRHDDDHVSLQQLARSFANTGILKQRQGKLNEAIAAFERAHRVQQKLVHRWEQVAEYTEDLLWSVIELAEMRLDLGERAQRVLEHLDVAEEYCENWLRVNGGNLAMARRLAQIQLIRAASLLGSERVNAIEELDEAAGSLEKLTKPRERLHQPDPADFYHRAVASALRASAGLKGDHVDDALDSLREAVLRGFANVERMERDTRLKPLRDRRPQQMERVAEQCRKNRSAGR